jgi:nucleoside 2-deoxyribosyltransferase
MSRHKIIYLANPYGFSKQCSALLPPIIGELEALGLEVWEPFARTKQLAFVGDDWAYNIAQKDCADVRACDAIFAIVNGTPPDEGVMIELGIAIALGKAIFLFRTTFAVATTRLPIRSI